MSERKRKERLFSFPSVYSSAIPSRASPKHPASVDASSTYALTKATTLVMTPSAVCAHAVLCGQSRNCHATSSHVNHVCHTRGSVHRGGRSGVRRRRWNWMAIGGRAKAWRGRVRGSEEVNVRFSAAFFICFYFLNLFLRLPISPTISRGNGRVVKFIME